MIPVELYLLMMGYILGAFGIAYNIKIVRILSGFFLMAAATVLIPFGIDGVNNLLTFTLGIISLGLGFYEAVILPLFLIKSKEKR